MYKTCTIILGAWIVGVFGFDLESLETVFDYELYESVLNPKLCQEQLRDMNTFEFYDASFRVPQSILKGNFASLGNFHQCLGINQDAEGAEIEGKYCVIRTISEDTMTLPVLSKASWLDDIDWVELYNNSTRKAVVEYEKTVKFGTNLGDEIKRIERITTLNTISFSLALCIPKTCSVDDILSPFLNNGVLNFTYEVEFCRLSGDRPLVAADYTAIAVFSIIGILTLLSTAYDILHHFLLKKDPAESSELLRCCSLYTNTKVLLSFSDSPSGAIDCIDGIRSISIMWIIMGHTFLAFSGYMSNPLDFIEWFGQRRSIWLRSATISVDTFFLLSGLLTVFTSVKKLKQMQLLKNLHLFYLYRYLRMFPLLACAVLLQASVFNQVSDGANWHYMAERVELCRKYWWTALLHVQNIVNPEKYCIPQTWYLSVDFQLHILSPLLLFWLLGTRRSAWSGLAIGLVASFTAITVYCFLKDFSLGSNNQIYFYKNTLTRAPPFLVGMAFGYLLHVFRGRKLRISFWWIAFGYISAWVVSSYCLYVSYADWDSKIVDNLNRSFMTACWAISVCWVIFACSCGYGGPINWFLSLKIWKFMARISYAMYLFHYPILFAIVGSSVTSFYFSMESIAFIDLATLNLLAVFRGLIFLSLAGCEDCISSVGKSSQKFLMCASVMFYTVVVSVAACVLIDAPLVILQKRLLKKGLVGSFTCLNLLALRKVTSAEKKRRKKLSTLTPPTKNTVIQKKLTVPASEIKEG